MTLTLEIPDHFTGPLQLEGALAPRRALEMLALEGYREGQLSRGQVSEILGWSVFETEAISLALELHADAVLMDERKGRITAESRGLIAVGTLNILEAADEAGLSDFYETLNKLRQTSFRVSEELAASFLERAAVRRGK